MDSIMLLKTRRLLRLDLRAGMFSLVGKGILRSPTFGPEDTF